MGRTNQLFLIFKKIIFVCYLCIHVDSGQHHKQVIRSKEGFLKKLTKFCLTISPL